MKTDINKLIEEIELDYLEYVEKNLDRRQKLLPVTKKKDIKALIWNLLTSPKWRKKISVNDYSLILDIWLERIKDGDN